MTATKQYDKQSFIKIFNSIAKHKHRYQVFSDFVTMSAIALHNGVYKSASLESEYMEIVGKYSKEEAGKIAELFANLIVLLEPEPRDILGGLYMEIREVYYTPAYYLGNWRARLRDYNQSEAINSILEIEKLEQPEIIKTKIKSEVVLDIQKQPEEPKKKENDEKGQMDLFAF